jgi:hypothetical protein
MIAAFLMPGLRLNVGQVSTGTIWAGNGGFSITRGKGYRCVRNRKLND